MRKTLKHLFRKRYVIPVLAVLIVAGLYWATHRPQAPKYETAVAVVGNVIEKVSVTGQVLPDDKADLAFEKNGVITEIDVAVGHKIKKGDRIAKLDDSGDLAALASAEAKLDDLSRPLSPTELAAERAKVDLASTTLANARQDALNAARTAFIQAQSGIFNYADSLFSNPQSANPTITIRTDSSSRQTAINSERVSVGNMFMTWKNDVDSSADANRAAGLIERSQVYVNEINNFTNDLSDIVNDLNPGNSGMTQSAIDADLSIMNSSLTAVNQAVSSLAGAYTELNNAQAAYGQADNNFAVAVAGSSAQSIRAQAATVDGFKAELAKDSLFSPMDGIITSVVPTVGEFAAAGADVFTVQSAGQYKIEAYVPEADIAKVALGDVADVTLDAYGSDTDFPAAVQAIDPAETVIEGVPTYKVTLIFDHSDDRIRSGMTANTEILTHEKNNVVSIPTRAVIDNNGSTTVRLLSADGRSFKLVPVAAGLKGFDGTIEIISGLSAGQKVVTYVK